MVYNIKYSDNISSNDSNTITIAITHERTMTDHLNIILVS